MKQIITTVAQALKIFRHRPVALVAAFVLVFTMASTAYAAGMGSKKVTLTNLNPSGSSVDYTFTINPVTTGSTIKRVEFQVGTTQGGSTVPTDMTTTGGAYNSAGSSGLGTMSGWTGDVTSNGLMKITNGTGSTPSNPVAIKFTGITNSSAIGTYYFRVTTYDATTGGAQIDQGDVAFVIANSTVTVTASVNETLSFALSSTSVGLGTLSTGSTASGNHTMTVSTNAANGYAITGQGSTLTAGSNTIPFTTDTSVTTGASEYGIAFSGTAGHPSGDADLSSSTSVASRSTPIASDVTTATYKASITGVQAAGDYTSSITYVATATF